MLNVRFHRLAREELAAASDWYEARRSGSRDAFLQATRQTLNLIRQLPESGSPFPTKRLPLRRSIVGGWPYWIVYAVNDDEVLVLAIAHMRRRPRYWARRSRS